MNSSDWPNDDTVVNYPPPLPLNWSPTSPAWKTAVAPVLAAIAQRQQVVINSNRGGKSQLLNAVADQLRAEGKTVVVINSFAEICTAESPETATTG